MKTEDAEKKDADKGKKSTKTDEPQKEKVKEEVKEEVKEMDVEVCKATEAARVVKNRVIASLGLGLIPIPLVDVMGLTAIQLEMVSRLSRLYEIPFRKDVGKSIIASLVGGAAPVSVMPMVKSLLKAVPIVGHATSILTMSALGGATTYAVGKVFIKHYEAGGTLLNFNVEAMKDYFAEQFEKGKKVASEMKN